MAHTTNINIGDGNANCGNITGNVNITGTVNNTIHKSDEDRQILRWLSPLEPNNRHEGVRAERFAGVGDWLLETPEFRVWRSCEGGVDKPVLFCSGNPGVGKTYLSSLVIDSLCDQAGKENIAVAGFYCDFLAQQEQTITNVMGAILKLLVAGGDIPNDLREAFEKAKKGFGGRRLLLPDLMKMLRTAIASLPPVFICIDALDEFSPKHLPELLKLLGDIVRESPTTRIFLTGRPHVREDIQRHFSKAVVIPISPNTDDIRSYLQMRLDRDTDPEAMSDDLRADIIQIILEKISDIFLLVSLNIDAILGEVTIHKRRKRLQAIAKGNGLSDAYAATLSRLKAQKGGKSILGLKVLMWVLYSERPLQAKELCHALGVEVGSTDLNVENVPALRTLLASCLGLVTVEASSSTIRLVHYTLQEHLSNDPILFHSPHSTIAEVCLTYLNFKCVRDISPILRSAPATMPLLEYASCYWGEHIRRGMTENAKALALRLLDRFDEHIAAHLLLFHYREDRHRHLFIKQEPIRFTSLHGAAFIGIVEIVAAILKLKEWDINATDSMGGTVLEWAAIRGNEEVVKMLLNREDVNPDQPDTEYGRTPLSCAAENGHEGIVKILLERDVNPDQPDTEYGRRPLSWAAKNGHEAIVKMLLERDVNLDQPDTNCGRTPLSWAAQKGHEGIVKILLERDVNPDQPDTDYGWTPLTWAAINGHEGIVKILLERDVNPDRLGTECGVTPLLCASMRGYEGIVKILLERDVNPDQPDTQCGRTPLSWAAMDGYEGIVKMLLERDVNPDLPDTKYGRTPLSLASKKGHQRVVEMLLERDDVNPNLSDTKYGQTPLSLASTKGHQRVVKLLLERRDVNPNLPDTKYGRTPLSWATRHGCEGAVKILLERKDVHTTTLDSAKQTPLSLAHAEGHDRIVNMLHERDSVNSHTADRPARHPSPPLLAMEASATDMPIRDANEPEPVSDLKNSLPKPADGDPPLTEQSLPQAGIHSNHPPSIPPYPKLVDRCFTIACFVCLLALLVYILPSLFPEIFRLHK